MKKGVKKGLKISGIVIAVLLIAIILIPIIFKGKILKIVQQEASNSMNAVVEFKDLNISIISTFPNLGVELEMLNIIGKDTFANDTLVKFDAFKVGLNLKSVMSGNEIDVRTISLVNPKINAKVLQNGKANWDIAPTDSTSADEPADTTQTDGGESKPYKVKLKKFEIKNAEITFDDRSSDVYAHIKGWNFELKGDLAEDITDIEIETGIELLTVISENVKYLNEANLKFDSELSADLVNSKYTFKNNIFKINDLVLGFDGFVQMPDSNIVMDIKFNATETQFKSVLSMIPAAYAKDLDGVKTAGKFAFNGYAKGTFNAVNMPAFGIDLSVSESRFQYPDLPGSVENINIDLKVDAQEGSGDDMKINLSKAHLEMMGNPLDAKLIANMSAADIDLDGMLKGKINLASLKDIVPMEEQMSGTVTSDVVYKGKLSDIEAERYEAFQAQGLLSIENFLMKSADMPDVKILKTILNFSPQYIQLQQFDANIGKSDLHLQGRIDNFIAYALRNDMLKGSFEFQSNNLDLNELAGGEAETTTETESTEQTTSESSGAVEIPKNLDVVLNTDLKKVLYDNLDITNMLGKVSLHGGIAELNNLVFNLLDGKMQMSGKYDSNDLSKPKAEFAMMVQGLDIPKTYQAFVSIQKLAPVAEKSVGKISANLTMTTLLDKEMMPVFNTLNSIGSISSDNIGIKENKLFNFLATATKSDEFKNPTMKNVKADFEIKNGILELKPTDLNLSKTKITVGGTQDLDMNMDFDLAMTMPATMALNLIPDVPGFDKPDHVEISADIVGSNLDPQVKNFRTNVTDGVKEAVTEKVEEVVEEVKEDVKAKAKQLLDDAQKKADAVLAAAKKAGDKLIAEAEKQGNELVKKANNPIAKKAAEETKKKMVKEAKEKSADMQKKAKAEADKIIKEAQAKADAL